MMSSQEKAHIHIIVAEHTKESLSKDSLMDKVYKLNRTETNMKGNLSLGKNMDKACTHGLTATIMMEAGKTALSKEQELKLMVQYSLTDNSTRGIAMGLDKKQMLTVIP
jgi:hypothetical protein